MGHTGTNTTGENTQTGTIAAMDLQTCCHFAFYISHCSLPELLSKPMYCFLFPRQMPSEKFRWLRDGEKGGGALNCRVLRQHGEIERWDTVEDFCLLLQNNLLIDMSKEWKWR